MLEGKLVTILNVAKKIGIWIEPWGRWEPEPCGYLGGEVFPGIGRASAKTQICSTAYNLIADISLKTPEDTEALMRWHSSNEEIPGKDQAAIA